MGAKLLILFITFGLASSPAFAQDGGGGGSKANLDLPFDAAGQQEEEEEAPEIVIFYGQQYEGEGIFFSCDHSGSMEGERLKRLKQEILKNVMQFSERVQFGIVFFDARIDKFPRSLKPAEATPALRAAAQAFVMSIQKGAGSCYKEGIFAALDFANLATVKRRIVIVVGDGEVSCNGQNDATKVLAEVRARNSSGVKINAILTIGTSGENFMKNLASQNGGSYTKL